MKEHKIHVFYSSEDKQSYRIIGSLLKRLELSARYWNSSKNPGLPTLSFNFQNTTDALSPLTEEQLQEINNTQSSVIMLVAPNLLLSENLLTSQAGKVLLKGNAESLRLFVYCQKIAFKEVLVTARSNHHWITGSTGQHLTYGTIESTVDDAACDANEEIQRCLKLWLQAAADTNSNSTRGNTMTTPAENRLNAEIDLVKAERRVERLKPSPTTSTCDFLLTMALALALFSYTGSIFAGGLGLVCLAMDSIIVFWVAKFVLTLRRRHQAQKAYDAAIAQEEAYETRVGLIGAN